jgi:uncharacterized ferritin-like protein (DUF455 family)
MRFRCLPLFFLMSLTACVGLFKKQELAVDYASQQMSCDAGQLQTKQVESKLYRGTFVVEGCGQEESVVVQCSMTAPCYSLSHEEWAARQQPVAPAGNHGYGQPSTAGSASQIGPLDGSSSGGGGAPASSAAPAPQSTYVSATLRNTCPNTVKLFFGDKPKYGSGTSSSLGANTSRSVSGNAGDTESLEDKLSPGPPPSRWCGPDELEAVLVDRPGRPPELRVEDKGRRTPGLEALRQPEGRASLLHTFLHHELQAAELMCRTVLAHPETPMAFRRGLINITQDEIRHMELYQEHLAVLGFTFGDFGVNDWFWKRLPIEVTPLQFVALMGLGFEGANLDHTQRFAERFRQVGDEAGAALQERVGEEEVPHVAFGAHWFRKFSGRELTFDNWVEALPPPLSPKLLRGKPVRRETRVRAGYPEDFVDELIAWRPET